MYVEKPATCLRDLRSLANRGAILSLLEKNRDGIALRPALRDYREAKRLLDDAVSTGRLGVENVARTVEEWVALLSQTGWHALDWAGVRLFSDTAPDDLSPEEFDALLNLEREAGTRGVIPARRSSPSSPCPNSLLMSFPIGNDHRHKADSPRSEGDSLDDRRSETSCRPYVKGLWVLLPVAIHYQRKARREADESGGLYVWPNSLWNRPVLFFLVVLVGNFGLVLFDGLRRHVRRLKRNASRVVRHRHRFDLAVLTLKWRTALRPSNPRKSQYAPSHASLLAFAGGLPV
jgi:hypothetical protein